MRFLVKLMSSLRPDFMEFTALKEEFMITKHLALVFLFAYWKLVQWSVTCQNFSFLSSSHYKVFYKRLRVCMYPHASFVVSLWTAVYQACLVLPCIHNYLGSTTAHKSKYMLPKCIKKVHLGIIATHFRNKIAQGSPVQEFIIIPLGLPQDSSRTCSF